MKPSEVIFIPTCPSLTFRLPNTPTYNDFGQTDCADVFGPFTVPEGKYWGMGDNRKNSYDSRWFGFIDEDRIEGRISRILFSVDSKEYSWILELIKHPIDFFTKSSRWNRLFKELKPATENVEIPDQISMFRKIACERLAQVA